MDGRYEIQVFGGSKLETINPDGRLVFKSPDTNMQDKVSSKMAPGKIAFYIKKGNQVIKWNEFNLKFAIRIYYLF